MATCAINLGVGLSPAGGTPELASATRDSPTTPRSHEASEIDKSVHAYEAEACIGTRQEWCMAITENMELPQKHSHMRGGQFVEQCNGNRTRRLYCQGNRTRRLYMMAAVKATGPGDYPK